MRRSLGVVVMVILLSASDFANNALAATIYVDANIPSSGNGLSWATAKKTLGEAVALGTNNEIWVKQGWYVENVVLQTGISLYGGFNGAENLRSQRDWKENVTVIDGNQTGMCVWCTDNCLVDGFLVINGLSTDPGAGIGHTDAANPSMSVANCIVLNCQVTGGNGGGGISLRAPGSAYVKNTVCIGNDAYAGGGFSGTSLDAAFTMSNCLIAGNRGNPGAGKPAGGIRLDYRGGSIFRNVTVADNQNGGMNRYYATTASISNCIVWNNGTIEIGSGVGGTVDYSNVKGGKAGTGNLDANPLFVGTLISTSTWSGAPSYSAAAHQTTLTNSGASWTANEHKRRFLNPDTTQIKQFLVASNTATQIVVWGNASAIGTVGKTYKINDYHLQNRPDGYPANSPSIDAGNPADDFSIEPAGNGGRINQGAYGNTTEAARSSAAPNIPTNVSPANGATGVSLTPTLQSSAFSDPDTTDTHAASQWQVSTSTDFSGAPPIVWDSGETGSNLTTINVPGATLSTGTDYYWRVRHKDNTGLWSGWSAPTLFTTVSNPPNQPTNLSPANGVTTYTVTPLLRSSAFSDPDVGDAHAASQWQIATANNFATSPPLLWDSGRTTVSRTSISVPGGILQPGATYWWRMRHQDNTSAWSLWSSPTWFVANPPPAAPSGLTGAAVSPSRINLSWTDNSNNETGFRIERKQGVAGAWSEITTVTAGVTTFPDLGLPASTTYYYRVRAYNAAGNSGFSNEAWAATYDLPPVAPSLAAEPPFTFGTTNSLAWTPSAPSSYLEWATDSSFTLIAGDSGWTSATAHLATGLINGQIYYYRVKCRDRFGQQSPWSNVANSRQDASPPTPPGTPTDAGAYTSSTSVWFTWAAATDALSGVATYDLQVGTSPGGSNVFNGSAGSLTTRTIGSGNGQTLYARARARDRVANIGPWSGNSDGITIDTVRPRLTGVTAVDSHTLTVTFNEAVVGADRALNYTCTRLLFVLDATRISDTEYQLTTSDQRSETSYTLVAGSAITDQAGNRIDPAYCSRVFWGVGSPAVPSNLEGSVVSPPGRIEIRWHDNANVEQGFKIERRAPFSGSWVQIASVPSNTTSYQDPGSTVGSKYSYRVRAYSAVGQSSYSNPWPNDKFILVAGGGNFTGNGIAVQTQALADRVFFTCRARGYTLAEIYYLSAFNDWATRDSNSDGLPDADAQATVANFWSAIDTWSSGTARLFVYLLDHGDKDPEWVFRLNPNDYIRARDLDTHLNTLQTNTACDVILIVDCCYAGGFVQECATPASRRVVIASTTPWNLAVYTPPAGVESFSSYFFSLAILGHTMEQCFTWTRDHYVTFTRPWSQIPWLDDDGDGDSDKWDGALADQHVLGRSAAFALNVSTILDVATTQTVAYDRPATLSVQLDEWVAADEVWAIVINEGATYEGSGPITTITRVNLGPAEPPQGLRAVWTPRANPGERSGSPGSGYWQALWSPGVNHRGDNTVTYFALSEDAQGMRLVASPKSSGLRVLGPASVSLPWSLLK